jgi:hypothetical protein
MKLQTGIPLWQKCLPVWKLLEDPENRSFQLD